MPCAMVVRVIDAIEMAYITTVPTVRTMAVQPSRAAGSEPAVRTALRRVVTPALSRSAPHSEHRPWARVASS